MILILYSMISAEMGFCNPLVAADLVTPGTLLGASEFARAVLQAEGMNSEHEDKLDKAHSGAICRMVTSSGFPAATATAARTSMAFLIPDM